MLDRLIKFWFAPADPNQYTAIRMGFALTSLVHLAGLWPLRAVLFSAGGMISGKDYGTEGLFPSLFRSSPSETFVTLAFVMAALAMIGLFLGVLPRLCAIAVAYWHYSLTSDLAPAASSYDVILRLVSYIVAISPLGDPVWPGKRRSPPTSPAYGLYLIRWQLLAIYVSTVWDKLPDPYWRSGQVISYFMMSVYSQTHSPWFANAEALSVLLTYGTLVFEISIPFLLFSARLRPVGLVMGLLLHGGIAATSTLWLFSMTMLMMYPAFISSEDVHRWRRSIRLVKPRAYRAA